MNEQKDGGKFRSKVFQGQNNKRIKHDFIGLLPLIYPLISNFLIDTLSRPFVKIQYIHMLKPPLRVQRLNFLLVQKPLLCLRPWPYQQKQQDSGYISIQGSVFFNSSVGGWSFLNYLDPPQTPSAKHRHYFNSILGQKFSPLPLSMKIMSYHFRSFTLHGKYFRSIFDPFPSLNENRDFFLVFGVDGESHRRDRIYRKIPGLLGI